MLLTALNNTDYREVLGQIPRLTTGGLVSVFNTYPVGNSGRSNVGILSTAPIPPDLLKIINLQ